MIKKKLRIAAAALSVCLSMCAVAGCGKNASSSSSVSQTPSESVTGIEFNGKIVDDQSVRTDLTATELTKLMGNGINLGNTMEAYGHISLGTKADTSSYETLWGEPVTTQEMITAMHESGFDAIRIPVAWTNMMDYESGDYTIDEKYFDRVTEIINYARSENMYVIINDHWDGSWWGMFGSATEATREKAMDMYVSMWTQIADHYRDYSDYLIYESANEELGDRLNDKDVAKDSGSLNEEQCYETTNLINQTFVDTIRSSGGNNENRFLLIAGYNTDVNRTCDDRFVMPKDTADSKLLVSVHFYEPSSYCTGSSIATWGTKDDLQNQHNILKQLTKFTDAGYGVIIGEYGIYINEDDTLKEGTLEYFNNFLSICDYYNYCPMLWDCNRLFNRNDCKIISDDAAQIYLEHSLKTQSEKDDKTIKSEAETYIATALANAKEAESVPSDEAYAWIMMNSSDWTLTYKVGDKYENKFTEGIKAEDVQVTGEGTYTVSLDFTGTDMHCSKGIGFAAVGIINGEALFPGYIMTIDEILINGEPYTSQYKEYTTSDDENCTRVNLYNGWVTELPKEARTLTGDFTDCSAQLINPDDVGDITTISVTFTYGPAN